MKFVRTARGYHALTLEDGSTVSGTPRKVSNEDADKIVALGEAHGVDVLVVDEDDKAEVQQLTSRTPDLSAGISFATGKGDPVLSPGTTPEGDEPDQADE